jgi:transcriptional regulator with XRE-family HTH domain
VAHSFEVFEKAGLRMYQVRDLLGVTQQTIASWLRQRTAPRPALLGALCQLAADTEVLLENGQLPLPQMSPRRWRHLYPKLYARLYRYEAEQCFSPYVC